MSELARYLAGDNYLTRSASGLKRGLSALADSLVARSNEGTENMQAALSGVRVKPGAILTDAGYVMPDASGQADFSQVGLEREPDVLRAMELFGNIMGPVKGVGIAAKSGTGGKVAADVARALPMDEASRMARAAEMGFDVPAWHVTSNDVSAFDLGRASPTAKWGEAVYLTTDQKKLPLLERAVAARAGTDEGVNVMPVMVRMNAPYDAAVHGGPIGQMSSEKMADMGFDGVVDGAQLAVFDPRNIRSRFAAFDPSKADSAALLAAKSGAGGKVAADAAHALPMDEASRMARAREMGHTVDAYHATGTDFAAFDPAKIGSATDGGNLGEGFYFSTDPRVGNAAAVMMPVKLKVENPLDVALPDFRTDKRHVVRDALGIGRDASPADVSRALSSLGHDGVRLDYSPTGYRAQEIMVMDPRNIRSRFAAFDPARANESDLLASRANLGPIVNALLHGYDR